MPFVTCAVQADCRSFTRHCQCKPAEIHAAARLTTTARGRPHLYELQVVVGAAAKHRADAPRGAVRLAQRRAWCAWAGGCPCNRSCRRRACGGGGRAGG
jgi:hypothetical protein